MIKNIESTDKMTVYDEINSLVNLSISLHDKLRDNITSEHRYFEKDDKDSLSLTLSQRKEIEQKIEQTHHAINPLLEFYYKNTVRENGKKSNEINVLLTRLRKSITHTMKVIGETIEELYVIKKDTLTHVSNIDNGKKALYAYSRIHS